jgi:4-hydroxy-4-methyl-2-oxoglutarate aldolase
MSSIDPYVIRLQRVDSCAVSDALDKLGLKGCVSGLPPLSCARRIAGRVHTVKLVAREKVPPRAGPPRHLGCDAIEAAGAGDVIVVEQRSGIDCGSWGGILSMGARLRGIAGVIADGPVRDVDEARQMDFPVFARSATARTARGRITEEATDVPVTIGDVTVNPGDYVVADSSAVVFVAAADVARVLEAAELIAAREAAMTQALRQGKPIGEVMGANYEDMLNSRKEHP